MPKLIPHNWAVPERFRQRLGANAGRQRAMLHDGHLLLVLHELPKPGDPVRRAVLFWRAPDGTWKASAGKNSVAALQAHVETFNAAVLALEERIERAERALDYYAVLHEVAPLHRAARNLHKTLQEARESIPDDRDLITLRDLAGDVERTAELVHQEAQAGLDFTVAKRSEQQAELADHILESNHRLNLIAALFFPATALGSILGMNMIHGLETYRQPYTFWIVAVASMLVGFLLRSSIAKRRSSS